MELNDRVMKLLYKIRLAHLFSIILLYSLLVGCYDSEIKIKYYPNEEFLKVGELDLINLDTLNISFYALMNRIVADSSKIILVLNNNSKVKKEIYPINPTIGCYKRRNVLMITEDSILVEKGYSIKFLKQILKKHYFNIEKNPFYAENYSKAIINVALDTGKTILEIRRDLIISLNNLTDVFDEIKDESKEPLELYLILDNLNRFPPSPPPIQ